MPAAYTLINRFVFALLSAASLLAGLATVAHGESNYQFSCALSCVVCSVAAMHYAGIVYVRSNGNDELFGGDQQNKSVRRSPRDRYKQNEAVDALRYSDWLITLPLLGIEINHYLQKISTEVPPLSSAEVSMSLFGVIALGAVYRFWYLELRRSDKWKGVLTWLFSAVLFFWVYLELAEFAATAFETPNDEEAKVLFALMTVWWVYPFVSACVLISVFACHEDSPGDQETYVLDWKLTLLKELAFGLADVVSKGGLALFVSFKSLRP